ncbi:MAG TPA: S41 family peptidase [bacterium]|nr:S41 family peptidase [bacterium]
MRFRTALACLCAAIILSTVIASPARAKKKGKEAAGGPSAASLYKELDLFTKVLNLVQDDYVEDPDGRELVYGAIRGLLSTLDPHSVFMTPEAYRELRVDTEGRFGGVGLEVTVRNNVLTVVTAIEGSPAEKAGVHAGDRILKIDGVSTKEIGLAEAVRKMRGSRGSKVHLTLLREGQRDPIEVSLHRDTIRIKSVRSSLEEGGFGYVRIASFQEDTDEDLRKNLDALEKKNKGPLKGLVIDLRNNPGGLLDEAVDVSDEFLESGTIVTTASRNHEVDRRIATKSGKEPSYPLIIMVNGGSASAAEIVAGALQDHKRAVLLGTQTFGKGTVQTIFELGDGAALKLTVAKYYTPKGRSIQAEGIKPDVVVEAQKPRQTGSPASKDRYVSEKDLAGHLEKKVEKKKEAEAAKTEEEDYQKRVALNYLKSWQVFQKK